MRESTKALLKLAIREEGNNGVVVVVVVVRRARGNVSVAGLDF